MNLRTQSGVTLAETAVASAIAAVALGGALFSVAAFGKFTHHQSGRARTAASILAGQTLRIAQDAWKYGSLEGIPSGSQTVALPFTSATTAPATVTASVTSFGTAARIVVTVRYTPEPGRPGDSGVVTLTGELSARAPLPGSQITRPGLVPMPSGAP